MLDSQSLGEAFQNIFPVPVFNKVIVLNSLDKVPPHIFMMTMEDLLDQGW